MNRSKRFPSGDHVPATTAWIAGGSLVLACGCGPTATPSERTESVKQAVYTPTSAQYLGGDVMNTGHITIYYLFYGNNFQPGTTAILDDFAYSVGASPWFAVGTQFTGSDGVPIRNDIGWGGDTNILGYPLGTTLGSDGISNLIKTEIELGVLPRDPNGVYVFVTDQNSSNVGTGLFGSYCTDFCGFHDLVNVPDNTGKLTPIKFVVAPDPVPCEEAAIFADALVGGTGLGCMSASSLSGGGPNTPNNDAEADFLVETIGHELREAITDPNANAWVVNPPAPNIKSVTEVNDACDESANPWGPNPSFQVSATALANVRLGDRFYELDATFDRDLNQCSIRQGQIYQATGDFNNDHFADFAEYTPSTGEIVVHPNNANNSFGSQVLAQGQACSGSWCTVMIGDFDGDGFADFASRDRRTGVFTISRNTTQTQNGVLQFAPMLLANSEQQAGGTTCAGLDCDVLVGDFTGDGFADYADYDNNHQIAYIHENNRDGTFKGAGNNWSTTAIPCGQIAFDLDCELWIGDFNNDKRADIAVHYLTGSTFVVTILFNNGPGQAFSFAQWPGPLAPPQPSWAFDTMAGDYNGDGITDFAFHDLGSGTFSVFPGTVLQAFYASAAFTGRTCSGPNCRVLGAPRE